MLQGFVSAFGTLLLVVLILYLAWLATKYVGKSGKFGQYARDSRYITVMDQVMLGQDECVSLVKISGRYFLLGVTSDQISLLTELADGEWVDTPAIPQTSLGGGADFKEIMKKLKDRKK